VSSFSSGAFTRRFPEARVTCIVTDSTADIPPEIARKLGIRVVPAIVTFGLESLRDGVDINHDEFYARLAIDPSHPKTATPASGAFAEQYREIARDDPEIVSIHVAESLSGLIQSARLGAEMVKEARVSVVDSGQASMAIGLQVIEAAEAAQAGATRAQIVELLDGIRSRAILYAAIDTLEYLRRSGRVRWFAAAFGNLIHMKPILVLQDGVLSLADKVISAASSESFLMARIRELKPFDRVWILHAAAYEHARAFAEKVASALDTPLPSISQVGSVIGSHTGPGAIGFAAITPRSGARRDGRVE
jgi:DegV family protein with EDD domain